MWRVLLVLTLMLVLIGVPQGGIGIHVQEAYAAGGVCRGGSGIYGDPYLIEDVYDLQAMNDDLTAHYDLANDIDASPTSGWNDGQGHTITGLFIDRPGEDLVGLFGLIGSDGEVRNVGLVDSQVAGLELVGALAGANRGLVEGVFSSGIISGTESIGGLVGVNAATIRESHSSASVSGDEGWVIEASSIDLNDGYPYLSWQQGNSPIWLMYREVSIAGTFTAKNKTYDGTDDAEFEIYDLELEGVSGDDEVYLVDVVIRFEDADAGDEKQVSITSAGLGGAAAGQYVLTLANAPSAVADIVSASMTITADDVDKTYDGEPAAFNVTYDGFVSGEGPDDLSGTLIFITEPDHPAVNAGNYTITPAGLNSTNYQITYEDGSLTVQRRAVTVTADRKAKAYGEVDPHLTWRITSGSLVVGDIIVGELIRGAGEEIGSYNITRGTLAIDDGVGGNNYDLTFVEGTFTIRDDRMSLHPCFIATAAYGSPMAEEVEVLREFRDEYMLTNPVGRTFAELYYRVSPPMAAFIDDHPGLKPIVRAGLKPAIGMGTLVVSTGSAQKIGVLAGLALVSAAVALFATRRRGRRSHYC